MQFSKTIVQEIAQKNATAEQLFDYLSTRERNARGGENSVQSIKQQMALKGFQPVPQELLSTLRELDRAGIIELKGDRFRWKHQIKDVVKAVQETAPKAVALEPAIPMSLKTLVVRLDNTRQFTATFPAKMTAEERNLISQLLAENS